MYRQISDFAPQLDNEHSRDPLLYCALDTMDAQFLHGATGRIYGRYSQHCAEFLSTRCAAEWDHVCEAISKDKEGRYPNESSSTLSGGTPPCLPYGEQLIRDAAFKRFKTEVQDCNVQCEPFDPTIANSPLVCYETRRRCSAGTTQPWEMCMGTAEYGQCQPIFVITPEQAQQLDDDPLMNKLISNPQIAMDLLEEIYFNMKRANTLSLLRNTRLARFYEYLGHPVY